MLFWHNQPEHLWPSPRELYPGPLCSLLREALPFPYLKQEELANIPEWSSPAPRSSQYYENVVRVFFHDRCLQYTEQQQLDGWRWSRPGDRILDIDSPLSVGVLEPQVLPSQLNIMEFYWDPTKRTSLFLQFTPQKKGGEKGVPFRLQTDTFKPSDKELPLEHLHSASCLVKVFKPKRADRKLKTDREKIEKQPVHERNKYQTACDSTVFMECSPWPEPISGVHPPLSPFALTSPHSCKLLSPERDVTPPSCSQSMVLLGPLFMPRDLNPGASVPETQQWLHRHRFFSYCRLLANFTGTDLLKLTRQDLIQICGAADGIRLFNTLRARPIRHRLTLYVAQEASRQDDEVPKNPDSGEVLASSENKRSQAWLHETSSSLGPSMPLAFSSFVI
ncbi:unnamed protein product [Rangifer tarandus platyrhynchus]|uniref:Uncharacterized protein n=2 Tax=Rangifer tarandus platyrhynchus TaxID=3082113 RepID=A0ACB0EJY8_RANTA|nr:unnamed protein product [Rangifer tarandus platyrhynchus]CAI9700888.1 unnamed protein product [Rangifer tarandus platyrhynchus]